MSCRIVGRLELREEKIKLKAWKRVREKEREITDYDVR